MGITKAHFQTKTVTPLWMVLHGHPDSVVMCEYKCGGDVKLVGFRSFFWGRIAAGEFP